MKAPLLLLAGLDHRLRAWRAGLLRTSGLHVAAGALGALLLAALVDLLLPLPDAVRVGFLVVLLVAVVAVVTLRWRAVRRLDARAMAARADELLGDPRKSLLTAYELQARGEGGYLVSKQIADSQLGFSDLPARNCAPRDLLRRARWVLLGVAAAAFLFVLLNPRAAFTAFSRLLAPGADIPPYSTLAFAVSEDRPSVIYGDDLEVSATISGGRIDQPVYLLTRTAGQPGRVERVECFRGSGDTFSQRVEKVTQPLEFAFAVGHARSSWRPINLLLEPRFALSRIAITPPAYTGRTRTEAVLGAAELRAVEGSEAALTVTSNRPLASGDLEIAPVNGGETRRLLGERTGVHTMVFRWPLVADAVLSVRLFDVQGTPSPEPLVVRQRVAPDGKPTVSIAEPGPVSLATPTGLLPVRMTAQDDFGLRRVALARGMPGLRERALTVGPDATTASFEFATALDLGALGVQPGDILELQGEARDHNPSLSGLGTSERVRVRIITEQEYLERLRLDVTMEEFAARYNEAESRLAALDAALEKLAAAGDAAAQEAARAEATKAARAMEELYRELGAEEPLYEPEESANAEFRRLAGVAGEIARALDGIQPGAAGVSAEAGALRERLKGEGSELKRQLANLEDFASVGRLMELAGEFMAGLEAQADAVRAFDRSATPTGADLERLTPAGEAQQALAERFGSLAERIRRAADELPADPASERLANDARQFADQLQTGGAVGAMGDALTAVKNQNAAGARDHARTALDRLAELLPPSPPPEGGNCFGGMCRRFLPSEMAENRSLADCLSAALGRGRGLFGAGFGEDGYAVAADLTAKVPMFGSPRQRFQRPPDSRAVTALRSRRDGGGTAPTTPVRADGALAGAPETPADGKAAAILQEVPAKYRSAIRRYFSLPETTPPTP